MVVEDLKGLFVEQTIDHRIEEALPLLARITQEANAMKEANIFESWVNNLVEGTWAIPETPEQKQKLVDLMSSELIVGPDATNATEQLYDILGDDILFDQLGELADADADADARSVILTRMEEMSDQSTDVAAVLAQLQAAEPDNNTADPAEIATDVAGDEQLPQTVEEGQCNMTEAGEYCPKHELEECGIMEYTGNWTNFGLEESDALSQLKTLAHGK